MRTGNRLTAEKITMRGGRILNRKEIREKRARAWNIFLFKKKKQHAGLRWKSREKTGSGVQQTVFGAPHGSAATSYVWLIKYWHVSVFSWCDSSRDDAKLIRVCILLNDCITWCCHTMHQRVSRCAQEEWSDEFDIWGWISARVTHALTQVSLFWVNS